MSTVEQAKSELEDMAAKAKADVNATFDRIEKEFGNGDAIKDYNAYIARMNTDPLWQEII